MMSRDMMAGAVCARVLLSARGYTMRMLRAAAAAVTSSVECEVIELLYRVSSSGGGSFMLDYADAAGLRSCHMIPVGHVTLAPSDILPSYSPATCPAVPPASRHRRHCSTGGGKNATMPDASSSLARPLHCRAAGWSNSRI